MHKICTPSLFLWFTKVKYVNSSSFSSSIESMQSLIYRFNQNKLVHNKLQILFLELKLGGLLKQKEDGLINNY